MSARSPLLSLALCALFACDDSGTAPPKDEPDPAVDDGDDTKQDDAGSTVRPMDAAVDAARRDAAPAVDASEASSDARVDASADASVSTACKVGPVPKAVRDGYKLDAFYEQYADANGVPVLASKAPSVASLESACALVNGMVTREDVRRALISEKARFVIIGKDEGTADVPEYGYRERSQADRDQINQRARGLGGQVASCGEENILCLKGDRYFNESICLHEFAHTISTYGVYRADRTFEMRLESSYTSARNSGILDNSYRKENEQEYWAEGVQDYYDTNASANPSNGIHNQVDTRPELQSYDATLYALVEEVFPKDLRWEDCHAH